MIYNSVLNTTDTQFYEAPANGLLRYVDLACSFTPADSTQVGNTRVVVSSVSAITGVTTYTTAGATVGGVLAGLLIGGRSLTDVGINSLSAGKFCMLNLPLRSRQRLYVIAHAQAQGTTTYMVCFGFEPL